MRHYIPSWESIGIKKERYLELLHFCRQYPDWKTEAASLLGVHGQSRTGMPHGPGPGDPVAAVAERRDALLRKIQIVEECANAVQGGQWYAALIQNVCMNRPYSALSSAILPTAHKGDYFKARKAFFVLLNTAKGGVENI